MLFPTLSFAAFFALVMPVSWLLMPHRIRWRLFLVAASWFFYGAADWRFVPLLAGSTVANHYFARRIHRATGRNRGTWTIVAVATNLVVLAWFKYIGFLSLSLQSGLRFFGSHAHVPLPEVLLPIGISFFTFQALSYVIDTSRGKIQPVSLLEFAVYLSFFPHLVAGPIVRATEFLPQIKEKVRPRNVDVGKAFWLICLGLFKKVVIASYLATYAADPLFGFPRQHAGVEALFGVYAYAIQIYADFSGYTDIAIGLALLLGIQFPQNFNAPYSASSLQEFWRRWHMTLSRWLRDYLYIPLGGSRQGRARTYVNVMITMLLGGLWHGAAWTFVAWGALHGAGLIVERWRGERSPPAKRWEKGAPALVGPAASAGAARARVADGAASAPPPPSPPPKAPKPPPTAPPPPVPRPVPVPVPVPEATPGPTAVDAAPPPRRAPAPAPAPAEPAPSGPRRRKVLTLPRDEVLFSAPVGRAKTPNGASTPASPAAVPPVPPVPPARPAPVSAPQPAPVFAALPPGMTGPPDSPPSDPPPSDPPPSDRPPFDPPSDDRPSYDRPATTAAARLDSADDRALDSVVSGGELWDAVVSRRRLSAEWGSAGPGPAPAPDAAPASSSLAPTSVGLASRADPPGPGPDTAAPTPGPPTHTNGGGTGAAPARPRPELSPRARRWVGRLITFHVVCLAWIFFRATSFHNAVQVMGRILDVTGHHRPFNWKVAAVIVGALAVQLGPRGVGLRLQVLFSRTPFWVQAVILAGALTVIDLLGPAGVAPFIYFRF